MNAARLDLKSFLLGLLITVSIPAIAATVWNYFPPPGMAWTAETGELGISGPRSPDILITNTGAGLDYKNIRISSSGGLGFSVESLSDAGTALAGHLQLSRDNGGITGLDYRDVNTTHVSFIGNDINLEGLAASAPAIRVNDPDTTGNAAAFGEMDAGGNTGNFGYFFCTSGALVGATLTGGPTGAHCDFATGNILLGNPGNAPVSIGTNSIEAIRVSNVDQSTTFKKSIIAGGTTFTASGCASSGLVGGAFAGKITSGITGTCTIVIALSTAPNGWSCYASDLTNANTFRQSASTTTTCTITGTTTANDTINFAAVAF
jgi:hypothetical protein